MKLSGGVEAALHCCVVLTAATGPVPAARLAQLHGVSATYLAKQLQALSRADLVQSVQGKSGGYVLTRPPEDITVLDVVEAVEGTQSTFVCTEIRQRGPLASPPEACTAPCAIARTMAVADRAWRAALREVSIADLGRLVGGDYDTDVLGKVGDWLVSAEP
ncbi:Rrf2 family transcriptional regulator [Frankia sp. CNm7]|uniref:Rrf2 family transcriptional regulator n=1 Tax=Frankia nepalensis TaxID=1836974 RepID=A0A937RIM8_9ACTN|nr:Rrf2 family transcriptional regulator [Frankia nepalensis]MBL7497147.1 Rrf2 family transcriptional regulator [Frankia nepalensis]MBL7514010.1 Rrf2 family transcriptional regulator [Frankia nepalensis]MBL7521826.1 Rrf2 family transcriptional regulator [Frankia nepalensis]MBL7627053.1 Rrf2 family transcriptional regulator [Frankia nepalensis]